MRQQSPAYSCRGGPDRHKPGCSTVYYAVVVAGVLGCLAIASSYHAWQGGGSPRALMGSQIFNKARQAAGYPPLALSCDVPMDGNQHGWKNVTVSENGQAKFTMWVYGVSDIVSDSISSGAWETYEVQQVQWALGQYSHAIIKGTSPPPVLVDIGANIGWFTLNMALRNYSVLAFEGMTQNAHMVASSLCANPRLASRVTLFNTGLGPAPDRCWIYSGNINVGDGHTLCGIATEAEARSRIPADYALRGDMNITRLDDILLPRLFPDTPPIVPSRPATPYRRGLPPTSATPTPQPPPLVLKMDVEGFEYRVLKGASQLLELGCFHYILSEWSPGMMGSEQSIDFLFLMTRAGFAISEKGFTGPFVPVEVLGDMPALWSDGRNLYLVHRNAPTFDNITFLAPAKAGLPDTAPPANAGAPDAAGQPPA